MMLPCGSATQQIKADLLVFELLVQAESGFDSQSELLFTHEMILSHKAVLIVTFDNSFWPASQSE